MKVSNRTLLGALVIILLGIWGCAESATHPPSASRIRHLESQHARLEQDYRATVAEVVRLRKQLAQATEASKTALQQSQEREKQLSLVIAERDDLKQQLSACQGQRDNLQSQMARFSRDLQSLAGQLEQIAGHRNDAAAASSTLSLDVKP